MAPTSPGTAIRRARQRKGWTQEQLADRLGVSLRSVNDWENDRTLPRMLAAVEELLGVRLSGQEEEPVPDLPSLVAANYGDEAVRLIWSREHISRDARLGLIAWYVALMDDSNQSG